MLLKLPFLFFQILPDYMEFVTDFIISLVLDSEFLQTIR